jgi:hypothetical protein
MSDANLATIAYAPESALGILASPSLQSIRYTGESLSFEKETVSSAEIRSDRQTSDMQKVGSQPSGGFEFELSYAFILPFLAMALQADWAAFTVAANGAIDHTDQTIAGAAGAFDDVPLGALVKIAGATTAGNNGLKRCIGKAADGSELTFAAGSFAATDGSTALTMTGKSITNGITRKSMTVEKRLLNSSGEDFYQRFRGMCVDTMELRIESKRLITGSLGLVGTTYEIADGGLDSGSLNPAAATGTLTLTQNAADGNTVTIGTTVYTFRTAADSTGEVTIGLTASASIDALIAAIAGDLYNAAHPLVTAAAGAGDTMIATAILAGALGNAIATTDTLAGTSAWGAATLTGGVTQAAGYAAAETGEVMNGTNNMGTITMDGAAASDRFKAITLSIANNLRGKDACGFEGNWDIGLGQLKVTGTINAYFRDNTLPTKIKNHTTFALGFSVQDAAGNALHFYLPAVKPAKGDPTITGINTDVMIETTFEAILGLPDQNPIGQTIVVDAIDAA